VRSLREREIRRRVRLRSFKRALSSSICGHHSNPGKTSPPSGAVEFRGNRVIHVYVDVSTVFHCDSPTTDALRQVRSTGKREDSLCLFLRSLRSCKSSDSLELSRESFQALSLRLLELRSLVPSTTFELVVEIL